MSRLVVSRCKQYFLNPLSGYNKTALFLVVSDDPVWVRRNLLDEDDTVFAGALAEKVNKLQYCGVLAFTAYIIIIKCKEFSFASLSFTRSLT